jgi:glucoamylase
VRRLLVVAVAGGLLAFGLVVPGPRHPTPPLLLQGLAVGPEGERQQVAVDTAAAFVPGTSVLVPAGARGASDVAGASAVVGRQRAWLADGTVPGATRTDREVAERALLDLRALTLEDGAVAAAWRSYWRYVWPRDASFVAAAYAVTGHDDDAVRVLRRLGGLQEPDGTWQARYTFEGEVPDERGTQLDSNGWFLWATWTWYATVRGRPGADRDLTSLWPTIGAAADAASGSLRADGLPPAGQDYWEVPQEVVTLGLAAPLLAGLRSASDLARSTGRHDAAARWADAAEVLGAAVEREFRPSGYRRVAAADRSWGLGDHGYPVRPHSDGLDSSVTFLGPPFGPEEPAVRGAVHTAGRVLALPHGGVRPGEDWNDLDEAWTPSTALLALSAAASGDRQGARTRLDWLVANRTGVGSFPERVAPDGPVSVAPLAWTSALVLLTLAALDGSLPPPPGEPVTTPPPPP